MKKIIVAAVAENGVIGSDNELIWHLPADLAFFQQVIKGQYLMSGRKSFESQQGEEIFIDPDRSIVLTHQKDYRTDRGKVTHTIEEAFALAASLGAASLYILGGAKIYEQTMDLADRLIITEVHQSFEGDAYFPQIDKGKWRETQREDHQKDMVNPYDYSFVSYERKDAETSRV